MKSLFILIAMLMVGTAHAELKCEKEAKAAAFRFVAEDALKSGGSVKPMAIVAKAVKRTGKVYRADYTGRAVTVETTEINDSYDRLVEVTLNSITCQVMHTDEVMGVD